MRPTSWRRLQCRLRGHRWVSAEIPGYRPDGRPFIREQRRHYRTRWTARH